MSARRLPPAPRGGERPRSRVLGAGFLVAASLALLLLVTAVASAGAQGLGDAASRERARRHSDEKETPAKVFTNDDLSTSEEGGDDGEPETAATGSESSGAEPGPAGRESDDEFRERVDREREERALKEREWRARFVEARARVREEEAKGWRDVIRTEFYQGIPVQMRVKEFVETEAYRQAKKDLADLQEEFRRTGLPPGWARE